jgi:Ca2+-binding RTX toxin-like protein
MRQDAVRGRTRDADIEKDESGGGYNIFTGSDHDTVTLNVDGGTSGNNNVIWTDGGDDTITIYGQNFDDGIPSGDNMIITGTGDDIVSIEDVMGADSVFLGPGDDSASLSYGDDRAFGGDGSDTISGGEGSDQIFGGSGNDGRLRGGDGNDYIFGGDGDDSVDPSRGRGLEGGDGDDSIFGGYGNDLLNGGGGNDRLAGGPGKDIFYYNGSDEGKDTIIGFERGSDEIRIYGTPSEVKIDAKVGDSVITVGGVELAVVEHVQVQVQSTDQDYVLIA